MTPTGKGNYMYMKDKQTRITLRLNEEQFGYLKSSSDLLGISPSEFLRQVINATMTMAKSGQLEEAVQKGIDQRKEKVDRRENEITDINNII